MMRTLLPALFLVAACGAGPQGDDESAFTIIRHPPPPVILSVQSVEPTPPAEGHIVVVHFELDNLTAAPLNGRVRSTVSPVGAAPFAGTFDWPITNLTAGQSATGVVAFFAPPAALGNLYDVFFEDGASHAQSNDVRQTLDVAGNYVLTIAKITADNPRSHDTDTVAAGFAGFIAPDVLWATTMATANLGAGQTAFGPGGGNFSLLPNDASLTAALVVANVGHSPNEPALLGQQTAAAIDGQGSFSFVDSLVVPGTCDGPLVVDKRVFTGHQLHDDLLNGFTFGDALGVQHRGFDLTVHYPGYTSPPMCGAVSNYDVVWEVQSAFPPDPAISPPLGITRSGSAVQFHQPPISGAFEWTVDGGPANGFIDATGRYTPPARNLYNEQLRIFARDSATNQLFTAYVTGAPSGLVFTGPR
jgi:hypothetical protein